VLDLSQTSVFEDVGDAKPIVAPGVEMARGRIVRNLVCDGPGNDYLAVEGVEQGDVVGL
jgi:hypothetical protein